MTPVEKHQYVTQAVTNIRNIYADLRRMSPSVQVHEWTMAIRALKDADRFLVCLEELLRADGGIS